MPAAHIVAYGDGDPLTFTFVVPLPAQYSQVSWPSFVQRGFVCGEGLSNGKGGTSPGLITRSEEHTSELQSRVDLVCRLLLEKKKKRKNQTNTTEHTHKL